jgi:hypothetical protein
MANPKGYILDRFASPIDGAPCVAIMTTKSTNRKTGDMMQVWILRDDVNPVEAVNEGDDFSICGNCPHRKNSFTQKRSCYVNVGQGPNAVWKAYKAGKYAEDFTWNDRHILKGRHIRWGAYGDPAIIDPQIFNAINSLAAGHTGYTHQWKEKFAQVYKGDFMASVDNYLDKQLASAHGWKTFHVAPVGEIGQGVKCPATVENSMAQCITCRLCDGMKKDVWVEAHGTGKRHVGAMMTESTRERSHHV